MKKCFLKMMAVTVVAFCFFTSCDADMYTISAQLNEPVYVRPISPGPDYVWISGEWERGSNGYAYRQGYWARPSRARVYVSGSWQARRGGYTWQHGYWRR